MRALLSWIIGLSLAGSACSAGADLPGRQPPPGPPHGAEGPALPGGGSSQVASHPRGGSGGGATGPKTLPGEGAGPRGDAAPKAATGADPDPSVSSAGAVREFPDLAAALAAADRNRGPLGRAATCLAAGDLQGALDACAPLLGSLVDGPHCRLLSAEALLALDRAEEAVPILAPARGWLGPLEPWGDLLFGEALAASGDPSQALAALDRAAAADPDGPLGRRAAPARVLALARAGRATDARNAATSLGSRVTPRVRLIVADALAAAGDATAPAAYRDLWRDHPGTPEADRAEARLAELASRGVTVPRPTAAQRLYRADRLLARGRPGEAEAELRELAGISGATPSQRSRARYLEARAAMARGDRDRAEEILAPLLAPGASGPDVPEALETGARLAMRRGDTDLAVARLDRLAAEFSAHRLAAEAEYLAAFFLYDAGQFARAETRFRAFATRRPRASRADEAIWYAAWSAYLGGRHAEAEQAFASFLAAYPRSSLAPQVRYWRGRALERRGDAVGAAKVYRELARGADGWYRLLAELRLAAPPATGDGTAGASPQATAAALPPAAGAPPDAPAAPPATASPAATAVASRPVAGTPPDAPTAPPALAPPAAPAPGDVPLRTATARARLSRAVALYAAGLVDAAGDELDAAVRGERRASVLEAVGRIALASGDAFRAHRLGARVPGLRGEELAYPRAYAADVHRAAGNLGVDPHFVWAIMRRESAFRPAVRSHAAAVGLMQLLPTTARQICTTVGLDPRHGERLGEPAVNIALGTWYLAQLLDRFEGNPALAAAGYNAGPAHVANWLESRKGLDLDEFVEAIPFRETRHYVKRVLGDLATYRRRADAPPPSLPWTLPEPRPGIAF